ncbi:ABC transporter permease [Fusibacter bizertensis]|jgi:spermidine/putrescine transport system permease protein|uniref:ABC transporter permease n=1 Tax=Fusibacter bizertensis TaxID=1488331 RepID=A0ABT6NEQ2_9FIRM|nr:ABC transporter permease [Fusibacter bizertensis]MDH8678900.1 ABC transporter permease [Fusibacter bizertensis]
MIKKLSSGPYLFWIAMFVVIPILMVFGFSMITTNSDGSWQITFSNFTRAFDPIYIAVLARSLKIAVEATLICFFIGYPMAMILAKMNVRFRTFAVMMFVVPMWMNFLLRTYAWMTILGKNGVLNGILSFLGLPQVQFLYSEGAVLLGMVYNFLPFMVLPIYTVLTKMDQSLIEAAEDLGGNKKIVFLKVIFPLSVPGILSGVSMVFMPAVSTFVISNLLYGGQYMLIGNLIEQQFLVINDWNFGSAVAMILMLLILVSMAIMNRVGGDNPEERGVNLW